MQKGVRSNIWKLYFISAVAGASFYYALDKVFMQLRGLSVSDIVIVEIGYAVGLLILEVPFGALADRWSRKYVLALNVFFFMLNTVIWVMSHSLNIFILGALMGSVHSALESGTFNSILFDSLKEAGIEKDAEHFIGRSLYYDGLAAMVSGAAGGFIAQKFGIELTFWLTLILSAAALAVCFSLTEPEIHRTTEELGFWKHIKEAGRYISQSSVLLNITALIVTMTISYRLIDEYAQLYFFQMKNSFVLLGILGAIIYLLEALGGRFAFKLKRFPTEKVYAALLLLSAAGYILMGTSSSIIGIGFAFIPLLTVFFARPLMYSDLHRALPSHYRATGESYAAFLSSLIFVPSGLIFGWISDHKSIPIAYQTVGAVILVYLLYYLFFTYKKLKSI